MNEDSSNMSNDEYLIQKEENCKEVERDYEWEARQESIVHNPFLPKRWKKNSKR